ncbi:unnamed protein product [Rhodiola kirilowii]
MCDASDFAVGAVLGQKIDKKAVVIYYASRTLDSAQRNYSTTEKELLAMLDVEIRDKKGIENTVADHLSRIVREEEEGHITESFPDEHLYAVSTKVTWYASIVNYLVGGTFPPSFTKAQSMKLRHDARHYLWDDPYLWKIGADQILRRCIPDNEIASVISFCHEFACGGHFGPRRTARKILDSGFFWPSLFRDAYEKCKRVGNVSARNEMP